MHIKPRRFTRSLSIKTLHRLIPLPVCGALIALIALMAPFPFLASANIPMWQEFTYSGPAGSRPYFVYTPSAYKVGTAVPLIVMLHGCTQTAPDFAAGTQMNLLAEQYNFIAVYPQQTNAASRYLCWNWYDAANQARGSGEPAIIAGIVQAVVQDSARWTIDTQRVYVAGISAGAAMAVILGATYPDVFAAIGTSAGVEYQATTSQNGVLRVSRRGGPDPVQQGRAAYDAMGSFARVVPTIVFQGTRDYVVNAVNGEQVVQQWMQTDRLASHGTYNASFAHPTSVSAGSIPGGHSYSVSKWKDSNGHELQEYWRVNGMGHAWSGGSSSGSYADPQGPDASLLMYSFFMNHSLPAERGLSFWGNLRRTLSDLFIARPDEAV